MDSNKLINAWREASKDLKINIQSPFILLTEDNSKLTFDVLIEDFGQPKGTIILSADDMTDLIHQKNMDIIAQHSIHLVMLIMTVSFLLIHLMTGDILAMIMKNQIGILGNHGQMRK